MGKEMVGVQTRSMSLVSLKVSYPETQFFSLWDTCVSHKAVSFLSSLRTARDILFYWSSVDLAPGQIMIRHSYIPSVTSAYKVFLYCFTFHIYSLLRHCLSSLLLIPHCWLWAVTPYARERAVSEPDAHGTVNKSASTHWRISACWYLTPHNSPACSENCR